jgi:hypothetical protein
MEFGLILILLILGGYIFSLLYLNAKVKVQAKESDSADNPRIGVQGK